MKVNTNQVDCKNVILLGRLSDVEKCGSITVYRYWGIQHMCFATRPVVLKVLLGESGSEKHSSDVGG